MAGNPITDKQIRSARKLGRDTLTGIGDGLYIRVRPDQPPQWVFIYRLGGERRKRKLGDYPTLGLKPARDLAAHCREQVALGIHPAEAARETVKERKAERQRKAERHTLRMLFDEWQRRDLAANRKDKGASARAAFERDIFKRYGDRFADELTKRDIQAIMDKVAERGARRSANVLRSLMRQMFGYALDRDIVTADPAARIRKVAGGDSERDRVLSPNELRELSDKLPASGLPPRYQAAAWIMLATCARVGELSRARWDDLDMAAGTWTIPAENAKNGREHVIHLSDFARHHFDSLPRFEGGAFVFPGRDLTAPIDRQTITKELRDRQRAKRIKGRTSQAGALHLSGGDWTAHDLRRTGATLLGELNISPHVIDRCLNHVEARKVTRIYQRQELIPERREAFERLGERLDAILKGEPGKVAIFHGKRRA